MKRRPAASSAVSLRPKVLLLTPDLQGNVGGVANYYNVLRLDELTPTEYFYVNSAHPEPALPRARRLLANYVRFAVRMLRRDYALIHFNPSLNANSFFRDGLFLLLSRLSRAPRLIFFRGWDDRFAAAIQRSVLLRAFFRLTYGSCRNFIVLGERFGERLRALGVRNARFWIETTVADTRPGPRCNGIRNRSGPAGKDSLTVLFMSRLLIAKGVLIAVDAVHRYQAEKPSGLPSLKLWVAGDGADEAEVRRYVESNGFGFVTFLGHITGEEKWRALEDADIFLFPTCYPEGLSNAVLEAMLHGLPVIARPEGALDEVLVDGVTGFVTASTDPGAFAGHLRTLAGDPQLYRSVSAANLEKAEQRFARDKVAARILQIYDQVQSAG